MQNAYVAPLCARGWNFGQLIRLLLPIWLMLAIMGQALGATNTTTRLTSTASSGQWGQSFTLTAKVTGSSPTGTVTFYVDQGTANAYPIGTTELVSGTATINQGCRI